MLPTRAEDRRRADYIGPPGGEYVERNSADDFAMTNAEILLARRPRVTDGGCWLRFETGPGRRGSSFRGSAPADRRASSVTRLIRNSGGVGRPFVEQMGTRLTPRSGTQVKLIATLSGPRKDRTRSRGQLRHQALRPTVARRRETTRSERSDDDRVARVLKHKERVAGELISSTARKPWSSGRATIAHTAAGTTSKRHAKTVRYARCGP